MQSHVRGLPDIGALTAALELLARTVAAAEDILRQERATYAHNFDAVNEINGSQDNTIVFDVGGQLFRTTPQTLQNETDHLLEVLGCGPFASERSGDDDSIFVDRDPRYFALVLEYLRTGPTSPPLQFLTPPHIEPLLREFRFYNLPMPYNGLVFDRRTEGVAYDPRTQRYESRALPAMAESSWALGSGVHRVVVRCITNCDRWLFGFCTCAAGHMEDPDPFCEEDGEGGTLHFQAPWAEFYDPWSEDSHQSFAMDALRPGTIVILTLDLDASTFAVGINGTEALGPIPITARRPLRPFFFFCRYIQALQILPASFTPVGSSA